MESFFWRVLFGIFLTILAKASGQNIRVVYPFPSSNSLDLAQDEIHWISSMRPATGEKTSLMFPSGCNRFLTNKNMIS